MVAVATAVVTGGAAAAAVPGGAAPAAEVLLSQNRPVTAS